ncbi:alanine racemase [Cyanobium sp. Morenito 9A2]|uniref:alanine racemase n=1 Tax=Cyanobium sp. Morenito 9A2 TaxID=2823718 RepID=UPI0020CD673E|nr:alanine racemase [Cyanobium sp. Morenito 9A2]MCP9850652.1 alanine racemase [Cyanobium sp. Morenito 9A2]
MVLPDPSELAILLDGELRGDWQTATRSAPLRTAAIDSRRVRSGDVFFALVGPQNDGHTYVEAALAAGAALAVVQRGWRPSACPLPRLEVEAPLAALQALAAWHRRRAMGRVLAITGSNGKTVVKEALTALLATRYKVAASPGSWNSQVGVPLAVLSAPLGTEIGVFEAGVSAPGEMAALAAILQPDLGVLVNVGLAHIAAFGTREATAREKLRLFATLPAEGWVITPDDPLVAAMPMPCERLLVGSQPRLLEQRPIPNGTLLTLAFTDSTVHIPVLSRSAPLIDDLLIAITAAVRLGVSTEAVATTLHEYSFGPTRMETWRTPDGVTIINDAASSDPLSVQAALDTVAAGPRGGGKRIFVFGGMGELGELDQREHRIIGRVAAERGFTHLVLLPHPSQAQMAAAWREVQPEAPVLEVNLSDLRETVRRLAEPGDTLLIKGPRNEGLAAAARTIWESMAPRRFQVDLGAIAENIARVRALCGPKVAILAVLKAWAYGTELARVASSLQESGVDWIGVSAADEGAVVRRAGVHLPILVMLMNGEEVDKVVRYRLTPVVYSLAFARTLVEGLRAHGASCEVHLEIDTGMGRLGVPPAEALEAARLLRRSGVTQLSGLMTHFSCADDPTADGHSQEQLERFELVVAQIRAEGDPEEALIVHAAATAAALRFPRSRFDMVRLGLGLYGIHPSAAVARTLDLQLAVAFVSRLAQVSLWPRGQKVGYGGTYVVEAEALRVGIVEAGYNDGVPWRLAGAGEVMVQGQRVRILGRISMDSMAVDLSGVPEAAVGDEVLIFGASEGQELRPESVAERAGTIPYELLVNVDSRRVQRVFRGD